MEKNILVVEDQGDLSVLLKIHLEILGHHVSICDTLLFAKKYFDQNKVDLIILDINLPDGNGLEWCKELRDSNDETLIMMLTAKSSEIEKVIGLESGADDYLTKPFSVLEFQARVKSLLRRLKKSNSLHSKNIDPETINSGCIKINYIKREVLIDGKEVNLTATEFKLLSFFINNEGVVLERKAILSELFNSSYEEYEQNVNSHINRLRSKVEKNPAKPNFIVTIWGVGYKYIAQENQND